MDASGQYLAVHGPLAHCFGDSRSGWQIFNLSATTLLDRTPLFATNVNQGYSPAVCASPLRLSDDAWYIMASNGAAVQIWSPDGWVARLLADQEWHVRPVVDMVDSMMVIGGPDGLYFADFGGLHPSMGAMSESTSQDLVRGDTPTVQQLVQPITWVGVMMVVRVGARLDHALRALLAIDHHVIPSNRLCGSPLAHSSCVCAACD